MAAIELLKIWRNHTPPFVLQDVPEGLANLLIAKKIGKISQPLATAKEPPKDSKKRNQ